MKQETKKIIETQIKTVAEEYGQEKAEEFLIDILDRYYNNEYFKVEE